MTPRKKPAAPGGKGSSQTGPEPNRKTRSSNNSCLDVATPSGQQHFKKYSGMVKRGMALVTPAVDSDGFVLGEVILRVLDTAKHQSGLYVLAELAAWSNGAAKTEMNILSGKGCLVHLCKTLGACKDTTDAQKVTHLREWKVAPVAALDEKYVTPDQRHNLTKKLKEREGKAVTEAHDEDDDEGDEGEDEGGNDDEHKPAKQKKKDSDKKNKKDSDDEEDDEDEDDEDAEEDSQKTKLRILWTDFMPR